MVALSASRLVWLAIALIRRITSPIFSPAALRLPTISVVCPALTTAPSATWLEWVTWRPISATEDASSSVAAATVLTLADASSDAAAAAVACFEVPLTLAVISCATRCMSLVACATAATTLLTSASNDRPSGAATLSFPPRSAAWQSPAIPATNWLRSYCGGTLDGCRHAAEFVPSVGSGDRHRGIAAGKAIHHRGDRGQRTRRPRPST